MNLLEFTDKERLEILDNIIDAIKPPPKLNVWQWAEKYRYLDSNAEPGLYKTSRTPYLKEIMEVLSVDNPCQKVVFMKSAQIGGSESGLNFLGYLMHQSPGPIMYVLPSQGEAEKYSKDRIDRMIEVCPILQTIKVKRHGKPETNTILRKEFKGSFLNLVGAQSAKGLRSTPIKYVLMSEVDAFPDNVDGEGDPVKLAEKRTNSFYKSKIYIESTPTTDKFSKIQKEFLKGNQKHYHCPCPFCEFKQPLRFHQLKYTFDTIDNKEIVNEDSIYYECLNCKKEIKEKYKDYMLSNGEWIADKPLIDKIQSYHINALYCPVGWKANWAYCIQEYLESKDDTIKKITFTNTILGETYKEKTEQPDWQKIKKRAEDYKLKTLNHNIVALFGGVDVQKNRLAYNIIGVSEDNELYVIDYDEIMGDPTQKDVWMQLDNVMTNNYYFENSNNFLTLKSCAIDSGYLSDFVYNFCRSNHNFYYPIKGANNEFAGFFKAGNVIDKDKDNKKYEDALNIISINTQLTKKTIYNMLQRDQHGPRYIHLPIYLNDNYFKMLTSEVLINKLYNGEYKQVLIKSEDRNEALDVLCYAYAIAKMFRIDDLINKNYIKYKEKIWKNYLSKNKKEVEDIKIKKEELKTGLITEAKGELKTVVFESDKELLEKKQELNSAEKEEQKTKKNKLNSFFKKGKFKRF